MSTLPHYYPSHMANSHAMVSSHVPSMCDVQGNKIALIVTLSKKYSFYQCWFDMGILEYHVHFGIVVYLNWK